MILFPVIENEPLVQEQDKTRLDARKSFVSGGSTTLKTKIQPDASEEFIDVSSEQYLDWSYGFKLDVVEGENDTIVFQEGGPDLTATLTPGAYTLAELAAEIATQMTAAGALTYTCEVNDDDELTIAAGSAFSLTSGTLLGLIGFSEDKAGAATYTGEQVKQVKKEVSVRLDSQIVVDASNNKLDYTLDVLGERSATVASGTYDTFEEFLDAVLAALNANGDGVEFSASQARNGDDENVTLSGAGFPIAYNSGPLSFSQAFTSDTGFSYNATLAEFVSGKVRQKDQRPTNGIVGATFTSSKNLSWSQGGSLTATDIGTPVLSGGKLQCHGLATNAVRYENSEIGAVGDSGALKLKYTPNYSGTPGDNITIAEFSPTSGNAGRLAFLHSVSGGTVRVTAYNAAGVAVHTAAVMGAAWSPVSGTEYELEFNWDMPTGLIRWFVNGVLGGSAPGTAFNRGSTATRLYIGAGTIYTRAEATFDNVLLFTEVQHTAGYTPGYSVPEATYLGSAVALPTFTHSPVGFMVALTNFTTTENNSPRYILKVGSGSYQYWNGSAWAASNQSYAQASDAATIAANIASLSVADETQLTVAAVFTEQNSQGDIDLLSVNYSGNTSVDPVGFDILCESGDNVETSAWGLLGFTGADKLGHGTFSYTSGPIPSVKYRSSDLYVISELADELYSTDQRMRSHEPDILEYVPEGRATHKDVHRRCQTLMLDWLNKQGWVDNYGGKITKEHLIDKTEVQEWATFMALRLIFEGNVNSINDIFTKKAKHYEGLEEDARRRLVLRLDLNKDGEVSTREQITPFRSGFLVRR